MPPHCAHYSPTRHILTAHVSYIIVSAAPTVKTIFIKSLARAVRDSPVCRDNTLSAPRHNQFTQKTNVTIKRLRSQSILCVCQCLLRFVLTDHLLGINQISGEMHKCIPHHVVTEFMMCAIFVIMKVHLAQSSRYAFAI